MLLKGIEINQLVEDKSSVRVVQAVEGNWDKSTS